MNRSATAIATAADFRIPTSPSSQSLDSEPGRGINPKTAPGALDSPEATKRQKEFDKGIKKITHLAVEIFSDVKFLKDLSKVGYTVTSTVPGLYIRIPFAVKEFARVCKNMKDIFGVFELPGKIDSLRKAILEFDDSTPAKTAMSVANVAAKSLDLYQPFHDALNLLKDRVLEVSEQVNMISSTISGSALFVVSSFEIVKNSLEMRDPCHRIATSKLSEASTAKEVKERTEVVKKALTKIGLNMINIAKFVSYLALSIIVILSLVFAVMIASGFFVLFATTALVLSLTGFFYDKILKPKEIVIPTLPAPALDPVRVHARTAAAAA